MSTHKKDLLYFQAGLPELKNYLLSDILYYPLMGQLPRLTIGGLLLAKKRLQAEKRGSHLFPKLATVKQRWYAAWTKKSAKELNARLTLWRNYLNDYRADPGGYAAAYQHEVRWRVILELLADEIDQPPAELPALDQLLHTKLSTSDFIWDKNIKSEFDQEKFWFLYGTLQ